MNNKILAAAAATAMLATGLSACSSDADVVSHNLSKQADLFHVQRQIVFYNGITDKYIAEVDGLCSLGNDDGPHMVTVTCKVGPGKFIKNYFFKSDNTTVFALQTKPGNVSTAHYKVVFKPSTAIPDIDIR